MSEEEQAVNAEQEKKSAEKSGAKNGSKAVKKPKKMVARVDSEPLDIIQWCKDGGEIVFDANDLPKMTEEELEQLPWYAVKQYKAELKKVEEKAAQGISEIETLSGNASTKLRIRKRRGWHQVWKRPDEFQDALDKGFVQVRKQKKGDEKPGHEKGEVLKLYKGAGEVELIAMEIPEERHEQHVKAMTAKSRRAYKSNKEGFAASVEEVNRRVPKESRVKVIDNEGDVG
jgi:hypothetical protein